MRLLWQNSGGQAPSERGLDRSVAGVSADSACAQPRSTMRAARDKRDALSESVRNCLRRRATVCADHPTQMHLDILATSTPAILARRSNRAVKIYMHDRYWCV